MTPLEQLLTGLTLAGLATTAAFIWLWNRELQRNIVLLGRCTLQRGYIRELTAQVPQPHPLADAILAVNLTADLNRRQRNTLRLADEQQQTRALADADHHALQEWK